MESEETPPKISVILLGFLFGPLKSRDSIGFPISPLKSRLISLCGEIVLLVRFALLVYALQWELVLSYFLLPITQLPLWENLPCACHFDKITYLYFS